MHADGDWQAAEGVVSKDMANVGEYLTLDRSLTYRRHLESLRKTLKSRVALLRRLAGSSWSAGATTLPTP